MVAVITPFGVDSRLHWAEEANGYPSESAYGAIAAGLEPRNGRKTSTRSSPHARAFGTLTLHWAGEESVLL